MVGAEQRPGQVAYQQFGETSGTGQPGSAVNPFDALIRRLGLNLPDIDEYCMMWKGLAALTVPGKEQYRIPATEEVQQMIGHISRGVDFVLFEKISATQRGSILEEVQDARQQGIVQYVLTYKEGLILRDAAAAVNVVYDPGTPDEVEKRTFKIADLERRAEYLEVI